MKWVCYHCRSEVFRFETDFKDKVTTNTPCGCVGAPRETMVGPPEACPDLKDLDEPLVREE